MGTSKLPTFRLRHVKHDSEIHEDSGPSRNYHSTVLKLAGLIIRLGWEWGREWMRNSGYFGIFKKTT